MVDAIVVSDFGASKTRAIYTLKPFRPMLLLMEPQIMSLPKESIENYERKKLKVGAVVPEDSAWVECDGKYHAVGFLAKDKYGADLALNRPKLELAIVKTLAVVGTIGQTRLNSNNFSIALGALLPKGEYEDSSEFLEWITKALSDFVFRGERFNVRLELFDCLPEGGGALVRGRAPGAISLTQRIIAVVIVGYRNASIVFSKRGDMNEGITEKYGFAKMIELVKACTSGQQEDVLVPAIAKAGIKFKETALKHLSQKRDEKLKQRDTAKLIKAIKDARAEYYAILDNWLRNEIPPDVDEIILCGGTANYLKPELNALFSRQFPLAEINWCEDLEKRVQSIFSDEIANNSLEYRLTDAYGYFCYLQRSLIKPNRVESHV
ncbi:MAG TPA: ParM/StbA family protein [Leptolyngbyaceae cyanobacterium]